MNFFLRVSTCRANYGIILLTESVMGGSIQIYADSLEAVRKTET